MRLPVPSSSYAVLIGTSTYRTPDLAALPAVRHNLDDLAAVLTDPALSTIPVDHCVVVPDPADIRTVYRELQRLAAQATDTLIVYFAGHGLTGPRNELFLSLTETDTAELPVSALAYDLVRDVISDSPAKNRVVILDCCFSGRAAADMAGEDESIYGQLGIEGTYVLAATSANAVALAPPGARHTAFTGELLRLLHTGVPEGPELLTFSTIYRHLLHTTRSRGLPVPRQRLTGTADLLALTRNPAHAPSDHAPLPAQRDHPASRRLGPIWTATAGIAVTVLMTLAWSSTTWTGTSWIAVTVLSAVQGLSSVLPVSPSAHLMLAARVLFDQSGVGGLVPAITFATTAALLARLAGDAWHTVRGAARHQFLDGASSLDVRLSRYLVLGAVATVISIPVMGWLHPSRNLWLVVAGLLATAVLLGLAERIGRKQRDLPSFTGRDGLLLGAAYLASSTVPGLSSLGAALAAGLFLGFTRLTALRLAFLFAFAATVPVALITVSVGGFSPVASSGPTTAQMLVGVLVAYGLAYASISGLLRYVRRHSLYPFAVYLLLLGKLMVIALDTGVLPAT